MTGKKTLISASQAEKLWLLRRPAQFLLDILVLAGAFFLAYLVRFNFEIPDEPYLSYALIQLPFVVLVQITALFIFGAHSLIWRYVSIEDIGIFFKSAFFSAIFFLLVRLLLSPENFIRWQVPLSVTLANTIFAFVGVLLVRVLRRIVYEFFESREVRAVRRKQKPKSVLFVGAGRIGASAAKDISARSHGLTKIKGFIDDDKTKRGANVNGIKVLGTTHDLPRLVESLQIDEIILSMEKTDGKSVRRILQVCQEIGVPAQIVPSFSEIVDGDVHVSRIRDVEIEDLLGRDAVELENDNLRGLLSRKTILVTGAGGSIGSELVRQIAEFEPSELLLVERSEFNLFEIERELKVKFPALSYQPILADIADEARMISIFERFRPNVIFHAAALKHVPLVESNPFEAVKTNIFATKLVGKLAGLYGAEKFVLISTDKAVNPTSMMGATKRLAEIVIQDLNRTFQTVYVGVRFGNVLGSAGSVVPIFREQIKRGGPVTVTDPKMTRFFMTIPEAASLVLQAGALGEGGEIFILDMGEPMRVLDLAEDMIRLSGLTPYEDIEIKFSGIRPGEKLYEELEITGENLLKTRHPKIFIGKIAEYLPESVREICERLSEIVQNPVEANLRLAINEILPEAKITIISADAAPKQTSPVSEVSADADFLPLKPRQT